jgi:uncharacterized protein
VSSSEVIERTTNHVKSVLSGDGAGHDWWHVYRVWNTAKRIGQAEGADLLVVELAALLHDIAAASSWKTTCGVSTRNGRTATERF